MYHVDNLNPFVLKGISGSGQNRFALINNTTFDIGVMLVAGVTAFLMERNGFPIAPAILGVVLGGMFEENFATSMIKADGNWLAFFQRPIAGTPGEAPRYR